MSRLALERAGSAVIAPGTWSDGRNAPWTIRLGDGSRLHVRVRAWMGHIDGRRTVAQLEWSDGESTWTGEYVADRRLMWPAPIAPPWRWRSGRAAIVRARRRG
ncbi:MAG TPA: hypothetical protein VGG54_22560 [Trebonia sp.]|jgi:hypothetical protein